MNTLSKLGLAIVGTAAIGSVSAVFNPGAADAATLNGGISFSGTTGNTLNTGRNPSSDEFNLGTPTIGTATGDFVGVSITSLVSSFTINLASVIDNNQSDGETSARYSFAAIPNFFSLSNGFTFALDNGNLLRTRTTVGTPAKVSITGAGPITGKFIDASGNVDSLGSLTFTGVAGSGDYGVSLSTVAAPIPTPALLPGLIGLGVAALRRKSDETAEENV